MHRRQLLALSGSLLAGSAGCLSASAPSAESASTTRSGTTDQTGTTDSTATDETTTEDPATSEYADVTVSLDALQPAIVTMTTPDSIGVVHYEDGQYLLFDVSTGGDGPPPAPDEFSFEFDGTAHRPESVDKPWRIWRFHADGNAFYDRDSGDGLLLFDLPESADSDNSAADTVLTWPGGEWRPDEAVSQRLATPTPPLSVSVEIPDEIAPSESPTISVTVRNEGDVPGRFVAGLNRSGPLIAFTPVERLSMLVPAGGTETWELTDHSIMAGGSSDEDSGDGESDMTYQLDWTNGRVRREVWYVE